MKTIKEIIESSANKEVVHFEGEIVTKENTSYGKGKNREEQTTFLIKDDNYCVECTLRKPKKAEAKYNDLVKTAKIGKKFYFEGVVDKSFKKETFINIANIMSNIMLARLNHEEESVEIRLFKHIYNNEENEAIKLIENNPNINVNFEYNDCIPVLSAVNNKMYDLFEKIVSNPKFDSNTEDGFGETLFESIIYLYGAEQFEEDTEKYNERVKETERMIKFILNLKTFNFNGKDLNDDTAINIACEYPKMLWIVEALASNKDVDLNVIDDYDCTALTNAIRNKNTEAIKILAKRSDLLVRDYDIETAKEYNIKLEDYGIDTSHCMTTIVEDVAERNREECFSMACS